MRRILFTIAALTSLVACDPELVEPEPVYPDAGAPLHGLVLHECEIACQAYMAASGCSDRALLMGNAKRCMSSCDEVNEDVSDRCAWLAISWYKCEQAREMACLPGDSTMTPFPTCEPTLECEVTRTELARCVVENPR